MLSVPIKGAPACDQSLGLNLLARPLLVELTQGGDHLREIVDGDGRPPAIGVPDRKQTWKVEVSLCQPSNPAGRTYDCGETSGYATQELTIDPADPSTLTLTIPPPPTSGCWRDAKGKTP